MGWWKDLTKDSVSGVVVALVTGGGGLAAIVWLWSYIKSCFLWLINVLVYPVTMPVWAMITVSIILLIALPTIGYVIRRKLASGNLEQEDSFLNYTNDTIFGMLVSWRWVRGMGGNYSLDSLNMRCPICFGMLSEHEINLYGLSPYPLIKCTAHGCNWKIARDFERVSYREMHVKMDQEIDRRCYQKFRS